MFRIIQSPLTTEQYTKELQVDEAGAYVSFEGWVRNHHNGKPVTALYFDVYQAMAIKEGHKIIADAQSQFSILKAASVHRAGQLSIGECAVWVGVTAAHRHDAYMASQWIMKEIKHRLPIWKKETYQNGTSEWVFCTHHHDSIVQPA